jgi:hypothetical protein
MVAAWLSVAAVPCSAFESVGIDLGHSHATVVAEHACPHCPAAARPAAQSPGDCTGAADALLSKVGGVDLTLAAAPSTPAPMASAAPARTEARPAPELDRPPPVPLNVRFCTYLE